MAFPRTRYPVVIIACVLIFIILPRSSLQFSVLRAVVPNSVRLQQALERSPNCKTKGINFQSIKQSRDPYLPRLATELSVEFPYRPEKRFPHNIWQTWKVPLDDPKFPQEYAENQETWNTMNPSYRHYLLSDAQSEMIVKQLYQNVPDVVEAWNVMPKSILKADFFRYLILYARGGVYSDIDTRALKPVAMWFSSREYIYDKVNTAGLVVGIEADPDRPDWNEWYARRIQFCQWTIQAKKGHPMLRDLIVKITELTLDKKRAGKLNSVVGKDSGGDVMDWTGPGIFTDIILDYMNGPFAESHEKKPLPPINWSVFTGLSAPLLIDDVLVLPITSFSPAVGQMGAGDVSDEWAYSHHLFSGSWKEAEHIT